MAVTAELVIHTDGHGKDIFDDPSVLLYELATFSL